MRFRNLLIIGLTLSVLWMPAFGLCAGGSGHGEEGGKHGAGTKGWLATDTYRVMNFVVLTVLLMFLLRKPVSQGLKSRISGIQDQLSELEEKKRKAEAELAAYNEKLSHLDKEAEKIVAEYVKQGNEAKDKILKEATQASQKLEEQAKKNIEHEFTMAKEKLQGEIFEKALAKAEDLLKERITEEDQDRLVEEYLDKVVVR